MFKHHCTVCERTQLMFPGQVRSLTNTDHGIEVRFECWCGAEQLLVTGRKAAKTARPDHVVAA